MAAFESGWQPKPRRTVRLPSRFETPTRSPWIASRSVRYAYDYTDKFRQAICAFANDRPGHGEPGHLRGFLMSIARELKLDPIRVSRGYVGQLAKAKDAAK